MVISGVTGVAEHISLASMCITSTKVRASALELDNL